MGPRWKGHGLETFQVQHGAFLYTFPEVWHRDPRYFVNAHEFRPLRFAGLSSPRGKANVPATESTDGSPFLARVQPRKLVRKCTVPAGRLGAGGSEQVNFATALPSFLFPFGVGD